MQIHDNAGETIWKSEKPLSEKRHYSNLFPLTITIPMILDQFNAKNSLTLKICHDEPPKISKSFTMLLKSAINEEFKMQLTDWLEARASFTFVDMDAASINSLSTPKKGKKKLFNFLRPRMQTN